MTHDSRKTTNVGPFWGWRQAIRDMTAEELASGLTWAVATALGLTFLSVVAYFIIFSGPLSKQNGDWGTFGDFVGGFGGLLLNACTLIAVWVTVWLQRDPWRYSRPTARNAEGPKADIGRKPQICRALTQQTFENTFFRLLEGFREEARAFDVGGQVGLVGFKAIVSNIEQHYGNHYEQYRGDMRQLIAASSNYAFLEFRPQLAPYFRTLYHILKLVESTDFQQTDEVGELQRKDRYTSLLRAKLSGPELFLMYFNCLVPQGDKLKVLVERYGMLHHLDSKADLARCRDLSDKYVELYAITAFLGFDERFALIVPGVTLA